jgi:hypothetical protein
LFRSAGLDLNFAGGVFSLNNTRTDSPANIPGWSFSRTDTNCTATALDLAGNVIQFATGVPRITNRGILVEEARTNLLINNSGTGATGSTPPTGWAFVQAFGGINPSSYTPTTGTDNSPGVSFRVNGTTTATNQLLLSSTSSRVSVTAGSVYTVSYGVSRVAGTFAGQVQICILWHDSGGAFISSPISTAQTPTSTTTRYSQQFTAPAGATTANVRFETTGTITNTTAYDFTLFIGAPQFEQGSFATSPIITTGAAGTRDGEVVSLGTAALPPEGTIVLTYVVQPTAVGTAARTYGFNLTDAGNSRFSLRIGDSGLATTPVAIVGDGTALTTLTASSLTPGTTAKIAVSYSSLSAQFAMAVNGSDQTAARQAVAATLALTFRLGSIGTPGTNAINSPIARAQIIPRFLSAAERIALTAP